MRQIVKARLIAGVVCVTIPKGIAENVNIKPGDRLMIDTEKDGTLVIRKEKDNADA